MNVKPYHTPWSKTKGSQYISEREEHFESGTSKGVRTVVTYKDKKGSTRECTKTVTWLN